MQDLFGLSTYFPGFNIFSFQAPHSIGMGGYAWYAIQWENGDKIIEPEDVLTAGKTVMEDFDHLAQMLELTGPVVVGGFSQGAILTAQIMLDRPTYAKGYLLMSGYLLPQWDKIPAISAPILQTHGTEDPVIPFLWAKHGASKLEHLPHYAFEAYPMGHSLNDACLHRIQTFLQQWSLSTH